MTLPQYPQLYAISSQELAYIRRFLPGSQAIFSPMGVDFDTFSPGDRQAARSRLGLPADRRIVLFVGRLSADKGLFNLVQAFARLAARRDDVLLHVIGSGPLLESLQAQVAELALVNRATFVGYVSQAALPDWYRAADVAAMPSPLEWFGLVAVEAMACGTPLAACAAGGAIDIVRAFECGQLVPAGNVEALADAMLALLDGAGAQPNIARARARFDWSPKLELVFKFFDSRLRAARA
jgi:D-inositol-3-phosphate glycosyltransferase